MSDKIILPDIGEGIDQVEISEISLNIGDEVSKDDIGLIVETEKASMEIPVSMDGIIKDILINNGDNISPGTEIFIIEKSARSQSAEKEMSEDKQIEEKKIEIEKPKTVETVPEPPKNEMAPQKQIQKKSISASPSVRRFARELGCELDWVSGTGSKGRITICVGSGAPTLASCFSGVGDPYASTRRVSTRPGLARPVRIPARLCFSRSTVFSIRSSTSSKISSLSIVFYLIAFRKKSLRKRSKSSHAFCVVCVGYQPCFTTA